MRSSDAKQTNKKPVSKVLKATKEQELLVVLNDQAIVQVPVTN